MGEQETQKMDSKSDDQADKFLFFPHRLYTGRSRMWGEGVWRVALYLGKVSVLKNRMLAG